MAHVGCLSPARRGKFKAESEISVDQAIGIEILQDCGCEGLPFNEVFIDDLCEDPRQGVLLQLFSVDPMEFLRIIKDLKRLEVFWFVSAEHFHEETVNHFFIA